METPTQLKSSLPPNLQKLFEPEQFNQVALDEIEIEEALRVAREKKYFDQRRAAYQLELAKPVTYDNFTAEQLFEFLTEAYTYNGKKLLFEDDRYTTLVKNLCCYFTNDTRSIFDTNKGLALFGSVGVGKTALMKLFCANQLFSYSVVSILEITADYKSSGKDSGETAIKVYNENQKRAVNRYGHSIYGFCFDEIGTEEIPAKHFGESKNVFAEILQSRALHCPTNSTHITSNKSVSEFESMYGTRVYDRMKEMFNLVVFDENLKSFRR